MPTYVHATRRGWVYAPFTCEHCGHQDQGAVFMQVSAGSQTNMFQGVEDTRDLAMGTAHGNMEERGQEIVALSPCPHCGRRDELAIKSFYAGANPWLGWGGAFLALGLGGGGYLVWKGEGFGLWLMSPIILLAVVSLAVGAVKRFRQPPKGAVFHSVDPRPWAHLQGQG